MTSPITVVLEDAQLLWWWIWYKNLSKTEMSFAFVSKHLNQANIVSMGTLLCLGFLMRAVTLAL